MLIVSNLSANFRLPSSQVPAVDLLHVLAFFKIPKYF